jgi:hypothetical protein
MATTEPNFSPDLRQARQREYVQSFRSFRICLVVSDELFRNLTRLAEVTEWQGTTTVDPQLTSVRGKWLSR